MSKMLETLIRTIVEFSAYNSLAALGIIAAIAASVYIFVLATGIVPLTDNNHRNLQKQNLHTANTIHRNSPTKNSRT